MVSLLVVVVAALTGATTSNAGSAASRAAQSLAFSPPSGPVGTVISVTGTCTPSAGTPTIQMTLGGTQQNAFIFSRDVALTPGGQLSGTITMPAEHPLTPLDPNLMVPVLPGETFDVYATCDAQGTDAFKAPGTFTVTAPTTTTTTPGTSTTTAPPSTTTTASPTTSTTTPSSTSTTPGTMPPTTSTTTPSSTSTTTPPPSTTTTTSGPGAEGAQVSLGRSEVAAGSTVIVRGEGFAADTPLEVDLHSTVVHLASTRSADDGTFVVSVTVPAATTPGRHEIVVSGLDAEGRARQVAVALVVRPRVQTPAASPATPSPAPSPGRPSSPDAATAGGAQARPGSPGFTG